MPKVAARKPAAKAKVAARPKNVAVKAKASKPVKPPYRMQVDSFDATPAQLKNIRALDPGILKAYTGLANASKRGALSPKVREFIHIAADSAVTHLHGPSVKLHIANALKLGASKEEILEVLQLSSVLGIHGCILGARILTQELGGPEAVDARRDDKARKNAEKVKTEFVAKRGSWSDSWETICKLAPKFIAAYGEYSGHPWTHGKLDAKIREFVYIAIDTSTTHLYERGTMVHIRNALKLGATPEEIMEVIEITSLIGFQTCVVGISALAEELDAMA